MNDKMLPSDNPLRFRRNLLEIIEKVTMTIDEQITDEKLKHDVNEEAAKISVLSSGKMDKYEYPTDEKLFGPSKIIEQTKFAY